MALEKVINREEPFVNNSMALPSWDLQVGQLAKPYLLLNIPMASALLVCTQLILEAALTF